MALNFPNNPLDGDTFDTYVYDATVGVWNKQSAEGGTSSVTVSTEPPVSPNEGDTWFDSDSGKTYIRYDLSWVEIATNLVGPQGPVGDPGPRGIQGVQGPDGPTGPAGPTNSLSIGTVGSGTAAATITGTAPSQTLNLTLPVGPQGPQGLIGPKGDTGSINYTVATQGSDGYLINGSLNPTIRVIRGMAYNFNLNATGHPFYLQTSGGGYSAQTVYTDGVTGNGTEVGTLEWLVPFDAPNTLYYQCKFHANMYGEIEVYDVGPTSTLTVGSVTSDTTPAVTITGTAPSQTINFVLAKGDPGDDGPQGDTGVIAATSPATYDAGTQTVGIDSAALFTSPALTGTPTAPTATAGTNNTQIASTAFVETSGASVTSAIVDGAPTDLNTLDKLAAAINDDATYHTTVSSALALKADIDGSDIITAPNYNIGVTSDTGEVLIDPPSVQINLDFSGGTGLLSANIPNQTINLISFSDSNLVAGAIKTIRLVSTNDNNIALDFTSVSWTFVGIEPTEIIAGKTGILTITSFGTTSSDCTAAWIVEG